MTRKESSTAPPQNQPAQELNPTENDIPGSLTFDEILGLTDLKFLEWYGRDANSLDHLTDDQLAVLMERCAVTDPELVALKAAAAEDKKPAGPEDATLDEIDRLMGKVGYQSAAIDNLLKTGERDPGNPTFDGLHLPVTDAPSEPLRCILEREDGAAVLYAGRFSSIHGEPNCGKTWIALIAAGQAMKLGGRVVWMDVEDRPATVADRSRPLGLIEHVTRPEHFRFFNSADVVEVEALTAGALAWLMDAQDPRFSLVIIDSAERFGCPSDGGNVRPWITKFIEPWRRSDVAVLLLDHIPKRPKDRPPGAIGSQHKRAAVDGAALRCIGQCWTKTEGGAITLINEKDRPGDMPAGLGRAVATIHGTWDNQGAFSWKVTAPATESGIDEETVEAVYGVIKGSWPDGIHGTKRLQDAAGMRRSEVLEAVAELVKDGTVIREQHGRGFTYRASEEPGQEGKPDAWRSEPDEGDKQDSF